MLQVEADTADAPNANVCQWVLHNATDMRAARIQRGDSAVSTAAFQVRSLFPFHCSDDKVCHTVNHHCPHAPA